MSYGLVRNLRKTIFLTQFHNESTLPYPTLEESGFQPSFTHWTKIIKEAEKVVGYPTSFMNLRWLLSDEFANIAVHLRKVVGTNHPILETAKTILYNEENNLRPWGLIILLLSKALKEPKSQLEGNKLLEKQRMLAELTEMIRTGHYVHKGLLNIPLEDRNKNMGTALFGNKMAVLIGDYLLVTANSVLARIKNQDLSLLISTALRDISEGEFFGEWDNQNVPLPGRPVNSQNDEFNISSDLSPLDITGALGSPKKEWVLRTMYSGGSLFGRGCQGTVLLGKHGTTEQANAYLFGCHLCLAWQAASEMHKITSKTKESYSLTSAPVLFAINENQDLYSVIEKAKHNVLDIDYDNLKEAILNTNAVESTRLLFEENAEMAKKYLHKFGDNESITIIRRLIENIL